MVADFPRWRRVTTRSPLADDDVIPLQSQGYRYHSTNLDQLCDIDRGCNTYLYHRLDVAYLKNMSNVSIMKHQMAGEGAYIQVARKTEALPKKRCNLASLVKR